jgi:hypothetical protein
MATIVTISNVEKLQYNVEIAEGPASVTVVTGLMQTLLQFDSSSPNFSSTSGSFKALVDPLLSPGQFRHATATASLAGIQSLGNIQWSINDVEATLDDETGQVQVIVDVSLGGADIVSSSSIATITGIWFQVTTLAKV